MIEAMLPLRKGQGKKDARVTGEVKARMQLSVPIVERHWTQSNRPGVHVRRQQ